MNLDFARKINPFLTNFDFKKALDIAENELRKLPNSDFHEIIHITLLDQSDDLAKWIEEFYQIISTKKKVKALYFEMNGFTINTDLWYIDGFAYTDDGGLDLDDMDWLSCWNFDTGTEMYNFKIKNLEKLQVAFANFYDNEDNEKEKYINTLQDARDWCEQIIIAKYMEFMRKAHLITNEKQYSWSKIPVYFTDHGNDFILMSTFH